MKQWITTVVLAGLIAAIGTIVFVSVDEGGAAASPAIPNPTTQGDAAQPPVVIVPDTSADAPLSPVVANTPIPTQVFDPTATSPPTKTYTVQPGDTLYNIALAHGVTIEEIVQHSELLDPDRLEVGQVLTIPIP